MKTPDRWYVFRVSYTVLVDSGCFVAGGQDVFSRLVYLCERDFQGSFDYSPQSVVVSCC